MTEPLRHITAVAVPMIRLNVDTDAIIPSREMKRVSKKGLSDGLFAGWRYQAAGSRDLNPVFILNDPKYTGAQILLSGANFGCGSSREHAVWALHEYGFRVIIAPSFGAIFYQNSIRNGILPVELPEEAIQQLADAVSQDPQQNKLHVDVAGQKVSLAAGQAFEFHIAAQDKMMLLEGLDAIDLTMKHDVDITKFEQQDRTKRSWAYL